MTLDDAEISLLIQATRANLAPTPFPPRRDLSCTGLSVPSGAGEVLFHDIFRVRRRQVCCFVLRSPGGDARIAAAHLLKVLLRAAMHRFNAEEAVAVSLAAVRRCGFATAEVDVAAAAVRVGTGEASLAAVGAASAVRFGHHAVASLERRDRQAHPEGRQVLWLAVGNVANPTPDEGPGGRDTDDLVRSALAGTRGTAAVAIAFEARDRAREEVFTLSNDVAQIGPILGEIDDHLALSGLGREARTGLDVALDELLTNIVLYAYDDGQAHEIILRVAIDDGVLRFDIRDDGIPFDPTAAPPVDTAGDLDARPIGGLGLHFVRMVFDTMEYRRLRGWNTLVLVKHPTPAGRQDSAGPFEDASRQQCAASVDRSAREDTE